jgi:hypothetical protein
MTNCTFPILSFRPAKALRWVAGHLAAPAFRTCAGSSRTALWEVTGISFRQRTSCDVSRHCGDERRDFRKTCIEIGCANFPAYAMSLAARHARRLSDSRLVEVGRCGLFSSSAAPEGVTNFLERDFRPRIAQIRALYECRVIRPEQSARPLQSTT